MRIIGALSFTRRLWPVLVFVLLLAACVRPGARPPTTANPTPGAPQPATPAIHADSATPLIAQLGTLAPDYAGQPTPDPAHYDAGSESGATLGTHTIAVGDTLGLLAERYGTTVEELMSLNGLTNPDLIQVGQSLQVPGTEIQRVISPDFKILPDSELVYGPAARDFDARAFVTGLNGFLLRYQEQVEGGMMDGPAILQLVADRHSVNPRLLLAALEHRAGWVTQASPASRPTIMGYSGAGASSLYIQLSWAANLLNLGYYGRSEGGLRGFNLGDDTQVVFSPTINDATAGVQRFLGAVDGATYESWQAEVGQGGFYATFERLFGNPFAYTVEPILPTDLVAPTLELPWPAGETWYYTGGPHGAWNTGSAWGALDFVPPAEQVGCIQSDAWVTAMADGTITRSGHGAVVVDLDGDGYAGTGWAITYMHLETRDRAPLVTSVKTGDRLGHPSCEGGFSNGTHLHIVRSYNGRWISADGDRPFEMSGWVSSGAGAEYDGYLTRGEVTKDACVCREDVNAIDHP
jgi:LysM repeat protein